MPQNDIRDRIFDALKSTRDFTALINSSAEIIWVNDALAQKHALKQSELEGSHFKILLAPELSDLADEVLINTINEGFFNGELLMRGVRESFPASVSASYIPMSAPDDFMLLFIASDRSWQKMIENETRKRREFLNSIISKAPVGIFCLDKSGSFTVINDAMMDLASRTELRIFNGENFKKIRNAINPAIVDGVEDGLDGGRTELFDIQFLNGEFPKPVVNAMITPIISPGGEMDGVAVLIEDRTDKLVLAEKIEEANRLASIGVLAASVAHEVNNPLTVIMGNMEVLRAQAVEKQIDPTPFDLIQSNLERISRIANDLLSLSRRKVHNIQNININELVEKTVAFFKVQPRFKWIKMKLKKGSDIPVVKGDPGQIEQVLQDLFINAVQAIPKDGTIKIVTSFDSVASEVVIKITDTGTGIPDEIIDRVFEAFFTTKAPGQGTGLGLAVCNSIIKQHGGTIRVAKTSNKGTTFEIRLPVEDRKIN